MSRQDIEWVERRLITLGLLTARAESTGVGPRPRRRDLEVDEAISFDGKKKKARITVPRGWGDVQVQHEDGGVPVAGEVFDEQGKALFSIATDGSGLAAFKVRLGKYKVELGGRKKSIDVHPT